MEDPQDEDRVRPAEGRPAAEHLVEDDAQAVEVAAAVDLAHPTGRLLGAHVGGGAEEVAVLGQHGLRPDDDGQAEIQDTAGSPGHPAQSPPAVPGDQDELCLDGLCRAFIGAVSSRHPGGANAAFVDGSVKFIKDTIDSWAVDPSTATPLGVTRDQSGLFHLAPETRLHVWQVLTTRAGNEVVSASGF